MKITLKPGERVVFVSSWWRALLYRLRGYTVLHPRDFQSVQGLDLDNESEEQA